MASALVTTSHNVKRNINSQKHSNDLRKHPCETNGIFWKNEDSKGSRPGADAYIPGVDPTNSRKSKSLKWQPYKVQPKSSITSSGHVIKDVSPSPNEYAASENSTESQSTSQRSVSQNFINETRKVFLKDLCHEDKLRVANLIQELAKVGEQREEALLKLNQERDDYSKKVKELTDQVQWLSDEHKQTLCKMTDCHHLLNLYQHILIEQQQKKRRHSMPPGATNPTSKHNKENAKRGPKTQSTSLQLPPRQSSRAQPLGTSSCLGDNLQPVKHVRRSLSPSCCQPDSLHPGFSHHSPRLRRSLSPRIHPPDNLSPGNCIHHHSPQQRRSLSPSSFPPERLNTQHPKFNSSYLLPMTNEAGSRVSPRTSPCLSSDRPANKSPLSCSVPESTRPNLKPATAIYKTSPSAPGMYEKTNTYIRDHSDVESVSEFPNRFQRSPNARFSCSNNSGNQNNNNLETAECIPKLSTVPSCCNGRISSPSVAFPKRNATFTNKSKTRLSLGPLQDPIMSSTQRSSELRFNGSYVSQNTASNQSCVLRSPTGSIRSLPACFMSKKDSSTNPCAPLKFETAQSDTDFSYVRKLSFSSAQSLPTTLTHLEKAPHPGTGTSATAAVNEAGSAAVSKVSFADGSEELSNPGSPIRSADDGKDIKVPDTPNTDCFRLMSNEERRQFLLQQRALLEEERNRLLAILERPDLAPTFETALSKDFPSPSPGGSVDNLLMESRPNIVQGLGGALLITNNLPLNCFDKTLKSEPILRRNKPDSLPPPSPLPPPPPVYNSNEVEENFPAIDDDCCSLQSNCSFSSKQSSMSLIDLIDSIELKPPEDNNKSPEHYTHQNPSQIKKIFKQNIKDNYPQKQELTFENQVLQDIFFLN